MTQDYKSGVQILRDGAVATILMNRPDAGNALDLDTSRELLDAAVAVDCDDTVRAVLLASEGKLFCAGGDISGFASAGDRVAQLVSMETAYLHGAVSRLARMNKPLVVAVQGFAAGAGFSLAMLGDIVIAAQGAQFTLAYTGIGLTPDGGASWLLPKLVGLRKAQEMILLNPRLSAQQALESGLITRVVPDLELKEEAQRVVQQLASGPTRAFGRVRDLLLDSYADGLESHLEQEVRGIMNSANDADSKGAIAAFLEKRKPVFKGA
ncbi:enoyl-CoA hydratase/isomerase family protein [Sphingobium lactosutens]|nr:enoyl-CoA hydratase-related protein [Sphingobium lactosutens]